MASLDQECHPFRKDANETKEKIGRIQFRRFLQVFTVNLLKPTLKQVESAQQTSTGYLQNIFFQNFFGRAFGKKPFTGVTQKNTFNIHWKCDSSGWLLPSQIVEQVVYFLKNLWFCNIAFCAYALKV